MFINYVRFVWIGILAQAARFPHGLDKSAPVKLIIGGQPSIQGHFPYQILLRLNGQRKCGGALVVVNEQQVILTAAHCVGFGEASNYAVTAGDLHLNDDSGLEQHRQVTGIIIHESFTGTYYGEEGTLGNDIAILLIESPFELNENVSPIPLPLQGQYTSGDVVVSGWGYMEDGVLPNTLQWIQLPLVDDETCRHVYSQEGLTVISSMICAGDKGEDSCSGDSGGPLTAVDGGYLAEIVSWGMGCGEENYPGVNTKVSHYIDWINNNVETADDYNYVNSDGM